MLFLKHENNHSEHGLTHPSWGIAMRVSHITVIPSPLPGQVQPPAVAVDPAAIVPFQENLPLPLDGPALRRGWWG